MTHIKPGTRIVDALEALKDQKFESTKELAQFMAPLLFAAADQIRNDARVEMAAELAVAQAEIRRLNAVISNAQETLGTEYERGLPGIR